MSRREPGPVHFEYLSPQEYRDGEFGCVERSSLSDGVWAIYFHLAGVLRVPDTTRDLRYIKSYARLCLLGEGLDSLTILHFTDIRHRAVEGEIYTPAIDDEGYITGAAAPWKITRGYFAGQAEPLDGMGIEIDERLGIPIARAGSLAVAGIM